MPDEGCEVDLQPSMILQDPTMPVERSNAFLEVFKNTKRFCSTENREGEAHTGFAYTPRVANDIAALIVLGFVESVKKNIPNCINLLCIRRRHIRKDTIDVKNKIISCKVGYLRLESRYLAIPDKKDFGIEDGVIYNVIHT
jgi:hypothetical protein